ncbi:hypothetical protein CP02DC15_0793 [Chlamydia psittaci 02DC15]|uniref:Uncharacterized protein n=1 Tax=Chlamydia psittaci 99DC5 TaxID=1112251 RepID=A0ABP2X385_CHLPS|nr:hypothetical protein B595_0017 [Chlamydia psittaci 84/55]AFS20121.1 hypothetical protein B598_0018 [Chlamydia psittaci GR9]AFS21644.1 hypothetical protein B599_0016 [Chlamydia psittaci MN]AFS23574.1 hypothetical protein B601_0016 [Chlamydia psittaci WS/RT/E30]AFS24463.1 hypothetical protein B602_0015 [Chlamydia psittaci M56]AFS25430.1 hypothetical protein B603_0016 [Chlamydia psittaci WC]AFS26435.1 hypothetical protein B711_0017 [Chlamydia psittaci CP3]AFS27549.1 hypothetical protein B712
MDVCAPNKGTWGGGNTCILMLQKSLSAMDKLSIKGVRLFNE